MGLFVLRLLGLVKRAGLGLARRGLGLGLLSRWGLGRWGLGLRRSGLASALGTPSNAFLQNSGGGE